MFEQGSYSGDTRAAVMPEIAAELTIADFISGIDPALRAILAR